MTGRCWRLRARRAGALGRSPGSPRTCSTAQACAKALAAHRGVTHLFYTARAKHGETGVESVEDNVAMLRNVLDAVEPAATGLEHVHLVQGTKYYGMHLGPFGAPAREDSPRPDVDELLLRPAGHAEPPQSRLGVVRLASDLHLRFRSRTRA